MLVTVASDVSSPPGGFATPRVRWAIWGLAALLGIGAGVGVVVARSSTPSTTSIPTVSPPAATWAAGARRAPTFRLRGENGGAVSLAAFRGRPVILTFLDPLCRNYCPIEASRLNALERSLPAASRPAIVAVSVNMYGNAKRYLVQDDRKWQVTPSWRWAIGTSPELAAVWKHYGIGVSVTTKTLAGVTVRNIVHTEAAYLIDAQGYERALFVWPFRAADVKSALGQLGR